MTEAYDLFVSLIPRLQRISVANGYLSDAGASVEEGPVPKGPDEPYPYIRLHDKDEAPESYVPHSPTVKERSVFIAQAFVHVPDARQVLKIGRDLRADLKRALFGDPYSDLQGKAIDARFEGSHTIPPSPGTDVVIAEVRGSYAFTDHFDEP